MAFVIPKWTAHDVENWDDLLVKDSAGRVDINEATAALLNYMPVIGITSLTPETASDAWCRIAIYQALFGSVLTNTKTGKPVFLTRPDVFRHIGVETEGTSQSFAEFCSSLQGRAEKQDYTGLPSFIANGGQSLLAARQHVAKRQTVY